jgi:hypothetical protein
LDNRQKLIDTPICIDTITGFTVCDGLLKFTMYGDFNTVTVCKDGKEIYQFGVEEFDKLTEDFFNGVPASLVFG